MDCKSYWDVLEKAPQENEGKDPHLCPRSFEQYPNHPEGKPDNWDTDWWKDTWPEKFNPHPRTCSFCGGIHPEDAISLLEAGWEIEPTTKNYKWYIVPPGSSICRTTDVSKLSEREVVDFQKKLHDMGNKPLKGPPIKLYSWHVNDEQVEKLKAVNKSKE